MSIGSLTIINSDGSLDDMLGGSFRDGRVNCFIVQRGEVDTVINIGEFIIETIENNDDDSITLKLADKLVLLDKNTPNNYFPATIPFSDVANTPQPIAIGTCFQVPVVMFDKLQNRYQLHQGATVFNAGVTVRDRLSPLTLNVDYTIESPIAETGGIGYNLNSPADGVVTVQIAGSTVEYQGTTGLNTKWFNTFCKYLLVDLGGLPVSDFDHWSADQVHNNFGFRYGRWIEEPENIRELLDSVCDAHCGYHQQKNDGKIHFDWLKAPSSTDTATLTCTEANIEGGVKIEIDTAPGLSDTVVNGRNYHVFSWEEIKNIGSPVTAERKQWAIREYRYKKTSTTTTSGGNAFDDTYAHARNGCPLKLYSTNPNDAEAFIQHLESLYALQRKFYTFTVIFDDLNQFANLSLGDIVMLRYRRYDLMPGKKLTIVRIEMDITQRKIKIKAWG